jgi:pSer/pThr/pTyr-binding forkhead associated (FHA) protein
MSIVTLGSQLANDISIKDDSVSRRHCLIVNYADDVWLYDLGSTLGTVIDGQRVEGRIYLRGRHEVTIGKVLLRIASNSDLLL